MLLLVDIKNSCLSGQITDIMFEQSKLTLYTPLLRESHRVGRVGTNPTTLRPLVTVASTRDTHTATAPSCKVLSLVSHAYVLACLRSHDIDTRTVQSPIANLPHVRTSCSLLCAQALRPGRGPHVAWSARWLDAASFGDRRGQPQAAAARFGWRGGGRVRRISSSCIGKHEAR